jgi:lysophospholipase L1-like esterase
MKKIIIAFIFIFHFGITAVFAQYVPRYGNDIQTIRQYDKMYAPPANPILFVGSSSIRVWRDLERTFAENVVLNRGIGGAVLNDMFYYFDDLITPYQPRQVVLYVGENDLVDDKSTSDTIFNKTKKLLNLIRTKLPKTPIAYIAMKPSPSREKYQAKLVQANNLIRDYIKTQKDIDFIDVYSLMLTSNGKPRPELFVADQLHMNNLGYAIWTKKIKPYLLKKK